MSRRMSRAKYRHRRHNISRSFATNRRNGKVPDWYDLASVAFSNYGGLGAMARSAYKYTSSGVELGVSTSDGCVYGDDMRRLGTFEEMRANGIVLKSLMLSSIVEGVDQTTETYYLDISEFSNPFKLLDEYYRLQACVERDAEDIWQETHGCETCARHWFDLGDDDDEFVPEIDYEVGATVVWKDCEYCYGVGSAF